MIVGQALHESGRFLDKPIIIADLRAHKRGLQQAFIADAGSPAKSID